MPAATAGGLSVQMLHNEDVFQSPAVIKALIN